MIPYYAWFVISLVLGALIVRPYLTDFDSRRYVYWTHIAAATVVCVIGLLVPGLVGEKVVGA